MLDPAGLARILGECNRRLVVTIKVDQAAILDTNLAQYPMDPLAFKGPISKGPIFRLGARMGHFVLLVARLADKSAEDKRAVPGGRVIVDN